MAASASTCFSDEPVDTLAPEASNLLTAVVRGDAKVARACFIASPALLFVQSSAEEFARGLEASRGRMIHATPLGAMLGAGDLWMFEEAMEVLYQTKNDALLLQALLAIEKQFPQGFEYPPSVFDFETLACTLTADTQLAETGKIGEATQARLSDFNTRFTPADVYEGYHFNLNELKAACDIYSDYWDRWHEHQRRVYWIQVIGALSRLVSAVDAQILSGGIRKVVEEGKAPCRSFALTISPSVDANGVYFPLDTELDCRMGEHFAITSYFSGWGFRITDAPPSRVAWTPGALLKPLMQARALKIAEHYDRLRAVIPEEVLVTQRLSRPARPSGVSGLSLFTKVPSPLPGQGHASQSVLLDAHGETELAAGHSVSGL